MSRTEPGPRSPVQGAPAPCHSKPCSTLEALELDAMRFDRRVAEATLLIRLVVGIVPLEPLDVAVALEGQNMRG